MKKQLSGLLAIALAGAMCLGFAACGETTDGAGSGSAGDGAQTEQGGNQQGGNQQGGNQQGGNQQGGNQQGGNEQGSESGGNQQGGSQQPSLTKDTDFSALVSDKVTAAQWDAAFSNEAFAGVTVKYIMSGSSRTNNLLIDFGYQKTDEGYDISFWMTDEEEAEHGFIVSIAGTQATEYYYEEGEYTSAPGLIEGDSHAAQMNREWAYTFHVYIAYDLVGQFEKFTYDETLHAYTYAGDTLSVKYTPMEAMGEGGYPISEATLKFSGGKLAYAKIKMPGNDEMKEEFFYYDYGKTQIVIPENAEPVPEE